MPNVNVSYVVDVCRRGRRGKLSACKNITLASFSIISHNLLFIVFEEEEVGDGR